MDMHQYKPKSRTALRIYLGKQYYTYRKQLSWRFSGKKYAKNEYCNQLKYVYYTHSTPLYRKLKDVDMWYQHNKVVNLKIAVKHLDGVVLKPNKTFSFWKLVGKPTQRKGYVDGMVLSYGQFKKGVGGGLCQLTNLIYWMTLNTPLTVVERYRHSYDVFPDSNRTQPFGSGATCLYNYRDLEIHNGTNDTYQLKITVTEKELVGMWRINVKPIYTYHVYEKNARMTHEYWGGYMRHNAIYRKVYNKENAIIQDEYITENHALMMYEPFLDQV